MQLGEFAGKDDMLGWSEDRLDVGKRVQNAVGGLVEDQCPG